MRKLVFIMLMALLTGAQALAQTRTVTGTVTDEKGNPVGGASVQIKGSKKGTSTAADGTFSIEVPATAKSLQITSVGMTSQELPLGGNSFYTVKLTAGEKALDEVVVVGYGTQRRKELTGSIAQISGSKLKDQPLQSFEQGLSGRAAGVNISIPNGVLGNPPVVRVRGTNSISLNSSPLVVIDGVPSFTGDVGSGTSANNILSDINPSDIESIEILKDASAAAIYGSRASNGVLLITTKRGKQGRAKVNYESWIGWGKPYNLINVLNAQQFTDLKNEGLVNAGTPPDGSTRGFYTMKDANGNLIDTRWYDYIYRIGFSQNHNINLSGANESTTYYLSAGYTDEAGIFKNNNFKRMTGRFAIDHKVNEFFTIGGTLNYTNTFNSGLNTGSTGAAFNSSGAARLGFVLAPNVSPYNADGSYNVNYAANTIGQGNNKTALTFTNPAMLLDLNSFTSANEHVLANFYAQVKLLKGLNFKTLYGIDHLIVINEDFQNALHGDGTQFLGSATNSVIKPSRWDWQNTLTYDKTIAENHNLNFLLGAEEQYTKNDNWGAARRKVSDPFFNEYQGGFTDIVPAGLGLSENFLESYFGRINYNYKRKYLLSGNIRRDGYSAFAQKWGTFYGGSAGWIISEENFWKDNSISNTISSFRIRGSYGMVGNFAGINSYAYQSLFSSGLYASDPTVYFSQAGNSNLTWEKSRKTDIGFNAGLLKDRFVIEFSYYKNNISNLILNEPQAPSRGIPGNSIASNVGSMINSGVEITIGGNIISKRNFSWNSNFNISTQKNLVTALANNNADIIVATGGLESPSIIRVGESLGSFYAVRTDGINPANGQRIFLLNDGTQVQYNQAAPIASRWTKVSDGSISRAASQAADGVVIGPALPKYFGGFDNNMKWKNFDFDILLFFSGGNYVYNGTKAGLHDNRNWNNSTDALNRWTKPGDNALWPKVVFGDNISNGSGLVISNNVEKGNFIKIRNISLGYSLPKSLLGKVKLSTARIYLAAFNVFTFTKYTGFDPEIQSNNGASTASDQVVNGAPSVDRNSAPMARTINIGLNVGF